MQLSYQGLRISLPCEEAVRVEHFRLRTGLGMHGELELLLLLPEERIGGAIERMGAGDRFGVEESDGTPLFHGTLLRAEAEERGELALLSLSCVAHTYQWDLERHSRSFCDLDATYDQVIGRVLEEYGRAAVSNAAAPGRKIPGFLLQYEETDWCFLKRLATHFGTFLLPDAGADYGRAFLGMPAMDCGARLARDEAVLRKDLDKHYAFNAMEDCFPQETVSFLAETERRLALGEEVEYGRIRTRVTGQLFRTENGALCRRYELSRRKGIRCPRRDNPEIRGMSIPATVKERRGNCVRVHFDVDPAYGGGNQKYFTYAIESSSMYCMPEEGSRVHVYFPGSDEQEAVVAHAVRVSGGGPPPAAPASPGASGAPGGGGAAPATNPDEKSFSNVTGSELLLTPSDISVAADGGKRTSLLLDDEGNVTMKGGSFLLRSDLRVVLGGGEAPARRIRMEAGNKVSLLLAGEEGQGVTLTSETAAAAAFLLQEASVRRAPSIPPSSFDQGEADAEVVRQANEGAAALLVQKREEAEAKIRQGALGVLKVVACVAVCVATGGVAAPLMGAVAVAGAAKAAFDISEAVEGVQDYNKSQSGDLSRSYNPIRDTVFQGDEALYQGVRGVTEVVFGIVSSIAMGSGLLKGAEALCKGSRAAQALFKVGSSMAGAAYDSYMRDGKVDWGSVGFNVILGGLNAGVGGRITHALTGRLAGALDSPLGRKALNALAGTFVDTGLDGGISLLSGQPFDVWSSLRNNAVGNFLAELFGEPIDAVTGDYVLTATDQVLPGVGEPFRLRREYRSSERGSGWMGRGWTLPYESRLCRDGDAVHLRSVTGHTMLFARGEGGWENQTAGCRRYSLEEDPAGQSWTLRDALTHARQVYDQRGLLRAAEEAGGARTTLAYEGETLRELTTGLGHTLRFTFGGGRVLQISGPGGRAMRYRYEGDLLTCAVHPNGGETRYRYTSEGYMESVTDRNGVTYLRNTYDGAGRVVLQRLANGDSYGAEYDPEGRRNRTWQSLNGREASYEYNEALLVTRIAREDGTETRYEYDGENLRSRIRNRLGAVTELSHSPEGRLLERREPGGLAVRYEYDGRGDLAREEDSGGRETLYRYDGSHNRVEESVKIRAGEWSRRSRTHDRLGRVLTETDACGNTKSYAYEEGQGEPSRRTDAEGNETRWEHDGAGRRMAVEDALGRTELGYDDAGRVTRVRDGEGRVTRRLHDRMGRLVALYPPESGEGERGGYAYRYDFMDRLVETVTPEGCHRRQERDGEGNVTRVIHPAAYACAGEDGGGTRHEYDGDGRLIRTTHPDGGTEEFRRDAEGNLVRHVLPEERDPETGDGPGREYRYDEAGRLTQSYGPDGTLRQTRAYDLAGNLTGETDAAGGTTRYRYDLRGLLLEKREPARRAGGRTLYRVTGYDYDANGDLVRERHGTGLAGEEGRPPSWHAVDLAYDKNRRLVRVADGYGAAAHYRYDAAGRRVHEGWRLNGRVSRRVEYRYDRSGNLVERREELPGAHPKEGARHAVTRHAYDGNGNRTATTYPEGGRTERAYDRDDRLVSERTVDEGTGLDRTVAYEYDAAGRVTGRRESAPGLSGRSESYRYDLRDRLTHVTAGDGGTTRYRHDRNGRLTKEVRPEQYDEAADDGAGTTYRYDAGGNLASVVNALGETEEENAYDALDRLTERRDGLGNVQSYRYLADGALESTGRGRNAEEARTLQSYEYDGLGHMSGSTDGNGNRTAYVTDGWGRITELRLADGSTERYGYDEAGNLTAATDGNGNTVTCRYNVFGKAEEILDQEGEAERFAYDREGRLSGHTDRKGNRSRYLYDGDGNLLLEEARDAEGQSPVIRKYTYDGLGRLKTAVTDGFAYRYAYTAEGRLESKSSCGRTLLRCAYDREGRIRALTDGSGRTTEYAYDPAGRLREARDEGGLGAAYAYDGAGLLERITWGNGITARYWHDADYNVSRMVTETGAGEVLAEYAFRYDRNGNRTEKRGSLEAPGREGRGRERIPQETRLCWDGRNRLTAEEQDGRKTTYGYDAAGNRLSRTMEEGGRKEEETCTYNRKNQLTARQTGGGTTAFTYDAQGSIMREEGPEGVRSHRYDALNRQIQTVHSGGSIQKNRYDAEGLRAEMEENGRLARFLFHRGELLTEEGRSGEVTARFLRGHGVAAGEIRRPGEESAGRYYYHPDEQNSTALITGEDQEVENLYRYDAFGNVLESREGVPNRITYTGQQYDQETGQYYLRARFYNPVAGRFLQEDVYRGAGLNLYAYCENNPVMFCDPSGYEKLKCKDPDGNGESDFGNTSKGNGETTGVGNNTVPNDTYVFGNATKPRDARPKPDFGVENGSDIVSAQSPPLPKGKSVCADPYDTPLTGTIYNVPEGTKLPEGLAIVYDGKDKVPGGHAEGHSTIYPTKDMAVDEFNELYQSMPWEKGEKKK